MNNHLLLDSNLMLDRSILDESTLETPLDDSSKNKHGRGDNASISKGKSFSELNAHLLLVRELKALQDERDLYLSMGSEFTKNERLEYLTSVVDNFGGSFGSKAEKYLELTVEELQDFNDKLEFLENFYEKVEPKEFYRSIFPPGSFERRGEYEDRRGNGIVMARCNYRDRATGVLKSKHKSFLVFDDLDEIDLFDMAEFAVMTPLSYVGRTRKNKDAKYVHAIAFDIDYVSFDKLQVMIYQFNNGILPTPTFLVNSGHGVHLYYVLKYPIAAWPKNLKELTKFKHALTDILWTPYTSDKKEVHHQSITQGFRMPGSLTKFSNDFILEAFRMGGETTLHELMAYLSAQASIIDFFHLEPYLQKEEKEGLESIATYHVGKKEAFNYDSRKEKIKRIKADYDISHMEIRNTPMSEAKKRWPEWHEKRIVQKRPRGSWKNNEALYEWWLEKMYMEVPVGGRYHSIGALSAYGVKCGISRERVFDDAMGILDHFNSISGAKEAPFTEEEALSALGFYDDAYVYYSRAAISANTKVSITPNVRKHDSQEIHLKKARLSRDLKHEGNSWRENGGRKIDEEKLNFIKNNPGLRPTEYAKILNVSRPTVYSYLKKIKDSEK